MATPTPIPEQEAPSGRRSRRTGIILTALGIFILFALVFSQQAFDLTFLRPDTLGQALVFAALSALIFLLLVTLVFVLLRNLLKLYAERQIGVLGSRFRTRMVISAMLLSFAPVIFLFLFSYGLMNRSIDKWFSRPVEQLRQDSGKIADLLSQYAAQNAQAEADTLAKDPEVERAFLTQDWLGLSRTLERHEVGLQGGFAYVVRDGREVAAIKAPEPWDTLRGKLPAPEAKQPERPQDPPQPWRAKTAPLALKDGEYLIATSHVSGGSFVLVGIPLPKDFQRTLDQIESSQRFYWELSQGRKLVRRTYLLLLLLLTTLVLFASMWLSLYVSKSVTRPVAALAAATNEISRGNLDYRVQFAARDELGELVASFNRMAAELETSRRKVEQANVALEQRRKQIEVILESTPTGVLSLDAERRLVHVNPAFERMFQLGDGDSAYEGSDLHDIFPDETYSEIRQLLRRADRMGATTAQMDIAMARVRLNVAVTVASMRHENKRLGYVIVFEDFSDLLKAQKQAAWREVARRVAHEIKNPLTPIALSAERIRRHLERGTPPDAQSLAIIHGCAETIAGAVETVRRLVDEFSTLARFPAAHLQPNDVNAMVKSALGLFQDRLDGITIRTELATELPPVMADNEGIKRVVANLIDNAAEAMQDSFVREITISTALVNTHDAVEIVVADTGHGVTHDMKEKLFLPYFSTKQRGTGLGLAIVSRIMEDHHGSIRVEENKPLGARFIVELPLAVNTETAGA